MIYITTLENNNMLCMFSRALSGFKCKCPRAERISIRRHKYKTCPIFPYHTLLLT